MALPIQGISSIGSIPLSSPVKAPGASEAGSFQKVLSGAINGVEAMRNNADVQVQKFLSGDGQELHTAMIATQEAELSLELFQQVRNKVVQAYQEVMRMQV